MLGLLFYSDFAAHDDFAAAPPRNATTMRRASTIFPHLLRVHLARSAFSSGFSSTGDNADDPWDRVCCSVGLQFPDYAGAGEHDDANADDDDFCSYPLGLLVMLWRVQSNWAAGRMARLGLFS